MTFQLRSLRAAVLAGSLVAAVSPAMSAETVTFRYLAGQGNITPHELAQELGYFDAAGIKLEHDGSAAGGPAS